MAIMSTGFNKENYDEYKKISEQHNLPVFIAFVDEKAGEVYGNLLNELEKHTQITVGNRVMTYPRTEVYSVKGRAKAIMFFPMQHMLPIGKLDENTIANLKRYSTRNPIYDDNK
jgi:hypothetical protein